MRTFSTIVAATLGNGGIEMNIGNQRHIAAGRPDLPFNVFKVFRLPGIADGHPYHFSPCPARRIICLTVAVVSEVGVLVIDWTRTGLFPPMPTFPTITSLAESYWGSNYLFDLFFSKMVQLLTPRTPIQIRLSCPLQQCQILKVLCGSGRTTQSPSFFSPPAGYSITSL
jgi:hypothetical protein